MDKPNQNITLEIKEFSIIFSNSLNSLFLHILKVKFRLEFSFEENIKRDMIEKLYADTKWNLIRSGNEFEFNKDETSYKIILQNLGEGLVYIKLKLINEDGSDYIYGNTKAPKMEMVFYIFDSRNKPIWMEKHFLLKKEETEEEKRLRERIENVHKSIQEFIDAGL